MDTCDSGNSLGGMIERLGVDLMVGEPAGDASAGWRAGVGQALAEISAAMRSREQAEGAAMADQLSAIVLAAEPDRAERLATGLARLQQIAEMPPAASAPAAEAESESFGLAQDPELISDFVVEAREHLGAIEVQLLTLEQDPVNAEAINTVFRGFHTIKGLAGFLELDEVRAVAHDTENLLDMARNKRLRITPAVIDVILASADFISTWLSRLQSMLGGGALSPTASPEPLLARVRAVAENQDQPAVVAEETPEAEPVVEAEAAPAAESAATRGSSAVDRTVKVDTEKLDYLVDMVGELVIAQSLVRHAPELAERADSRLVRNLSQMARITDEVQKTAMSMRMVTVSRLFQKMARLTRDLSRKSGKQVEFETVGEDTEIDRNIVEELADPLMHMVRNAVDHGVETADERRAAGKDPTAHVRLSASHQSGQILIEITDDGRGLDKEKILRKGVEKGLVEEGATLDENEIYNLIFQPGFSTAAKITDVSGRGVGMDVVRKQLQKLRGRVDIQSAIGKGTTFSIKLPLTLAIIDGLVVGVGAHRYIVPIYRVREMLRPNEDQLTTVENRGEMVMVRDHLLPLVRLHRLFGVEARSENPWESLLIVAESEDRAFCLMVDELIGKQEVVIKSLGDLFGPVPGIAGGAILGDGRVGLILDVSGLYRRRT